ncbi:ABC transporter ATP-binding protein [Methylomonas fluvii]|uniref:ABC transporter ATP-binding protein n=1 Tax=Methylomonas fluvii TaxID=1854564 RepID=A0ABR9DFW6_9GAMM|nr:dipeptide ABC transporter ATP-binding protein [Methylomonas fluvii]MBD9361661.1 ABC transporter ATP-binding protein [Methylomonas fluvii]CAD6874653.1 Oligopeptide transport ATP-binding protein OppD (TC 3.A.1.5.1) [Methylomonas fluvii]
MSQPLLEVRNLRTYLRSGGGEVKAVDDISFSIPKGQTFCLVGESGSGKSVSALSVIRLLPDGVASHPSGEILLNGQDLLTLDDPGIRAVRGLKIAMIFQEPMTSLNPVMSIGEQITEALQLHHPDMDDAEATERTIKALEQVQIPNAASRFRDYPHQLSGGQRQRVMIAMALACEPQLLIADEPTTALDVTVQAEILRLMRKLQDDTGMSMLFITHDFGVVAQMAHWVGVMQQGKLVEVGACQTVLRTPQHPYTQQLLAAVPENLAKPGRAAVGANPSVPEVVDLPPALADDENLSDSDRRLLSVLNRVGLRRQASQNAAQGEAEVDNLIQIRDLKVWFPIKKGVFRQTVDYVKAVDEVSLDIPRGEIVALVGESGCGKTTLGRAVLQLELPTAGSIRIDGQELTGLSARELRPLRRKMQIAFQDPQSSLNPRLLVETTLTEPMKVHGIGASHEQRIELAGQLLEDMQLSRESLWRYPHEFSGGQRQRIGLARALALNPEFVVCDEITSALDVSVQAEILQLLLDIRRRRNLTLLFITHNIGVVEYLSDRTVVMYKGTIVEEGLTAKVCGAPEHPYTQKLLSAVPRLVV